MKLNRPPLYMPSSGSMWSVKLRVSSGSGKSVFMVGGRSSSERSRGVCVSYVMLSRWDGGVGSGGCRYLSAHAVEQR